MQYLAYGLSIESEITLPELVTVSEPRRAHDLHVRLGRGPRSQSKHLRWVFRLDRPSGAPWLSCARAREGYLVRFAGIADFTVTFDGREIVCWPATREDDDTLRHLLLDQVVPLTFKLRGREALHATAVRTPQGVCAFVGPTGSGKSTVAAGFLKAGYPVISDDCLILYSCAQRICAGPAYPGVRLWEDVLSAVDDGGQLLPVGGHTAKQRWLPRGVRALFPTDVQPLKRIYRLMRPQGARQPHAIPASRLEPMSAREAFMELVDATFRIDAIDRDMLTREFRFWEYAALAVPMRWLWLENDPDSSRAREAVLEDLGR